LTLLKRALQIIPRFGTLQEYRIQIEKIDKKDKNGFYKTKNVQYWGFHHIYGEEKRNKIIVVLKQVGDGKIIFWSVMSENRGKMYEDGIEDD
jgi:hypothetical protein